MKRKKHILRIILLNIVGFTLLSSQTYNYSVVMPVPDLSFHS